MIRIEHGDCLDVMRRLVDEGVRVDSVVTDPPYDLTRGKTSGGFMDRAWDATGIAFRPETWARVAEVMKPGAHLVAFGAPRTHHRMWCAIEDAGFEIRDGIFDLVGTDAIARAFVESLSPEQIAALDRCAVAGSFGGMLGWVFGQGFPKSLDVSKAIDKAAGAERSVVGIRPGHEDFVDRTDRHAAGNRREGWSRPWKDDPEAVRAHHLRTAPATEAARRWDGWGTALKPAIEPILLARKPLDGSVVENVMAHGIGGLNVDACRIEAGRPRPLVVKSDHRGVVATDVIRPGLGGSKAAGDTSDGRWPANAVHDGSDEVLAVFPDSEGQRSDVRGTERSRPFSGTIYGDMNGRTASRARGDAGSAARFFYCSKATSDDRAGSSHPTVKPIDLIAWLVRLVTPGGGLVLDPFAGSGTTAAAALREGCPAILIEKEAEHVADIRSRVALLQGGGGHSAAVRHRNGDRAKARGAGTPLLGEAGE